MDYNQIYNEDCLSGLKKLQDNSIDCCITSPPYYGLRDYGTSKWNGGNTNCDHSKKSSIKIGSSTLQSPSTNNNHEREGWLGGVCKKCGAKRIDEQIGLEETPEKYVEKLVEVFEEVRRVLKPTGNLWLNLGDSYAGGGKKGNTEGEKQKTSKGAMWGDNDNIATLKSKLVGYKAKDLIGIPWMVAFALRAKGWYLRQDIIWNKKNPMPESVTDRCTKAHEYIFLLAKNSRYYYDADAIKTKMECAEHDHRVRESRKCSPTETVNGIRGGNATIYEWANKRSVWEVNTKPFIEAHFATFPEELIVDCIKAGCPENGVVLDPFMGAGTSAVVAKKLGRNYIGFELNPDYIDITNKRLYKEFGMFL